MLPSPRPLDPIFGVQTRLVEPFRRVVRSPDLGWSALGYYLFGGVVSIAIWALFGGAITRTTIVHLGLARRTGLWDAFTFARGKWLDLFAAPTLPLVALAAIGLPFVVLGWLCRSDVGVALAGVFWAICVISGLLMAILALGLLFGWPLMWGAVACEDSDAFDAISRAYAYTFQRPMHYLYYGLCAGVLGVLGWLLAWYFVESIVTLCYWGANWGSGGKRLAEIQRAMSGDAAELSPLLWIGARLISLWVGLVRSAAGAFSFAYFWSASAAIYLLLRKDTDNTELDDVCPLTPREG